MRGYRNTKGSYTVVVLGEKKPGDDLEECMKVRCTNHRALSKVTGIPYHRIGYLFTRTRRSYVVEGGCMILRTSADYKGSHPGGFRPKGSKVVNENERYDG